MRCAFCSERKGKRECPALGAICSRCCGAHRRREILCPPDCPYLPAAPTRDDAHAALDRAQEELTRFAFDPARPGTRGALGTVLGARQTYEEWEQPAILLHLAYGHEDERGERAVDAFLRERGAALTEAERAALEAAAGAVPSLVEVRSVRPGEGLEVVDVVDGGPPRFVHERALTSQAREGDAYLFWIMTFAGRHELLGGVHVPAAHVRVVREAFSAARARLAGTGPAATPASCARRAAAEAHRTLREAVRAYVPRARSPEGYEVVPSWAVYEVRDAEPVLAALGSHPALATRGRGIFLWLGPPAPEPPPSAGDGDEVPTQSWVLAAGDGRSCLVVGHVELRTVRLTLFCQSRERLAEGRRLLEGLLGGRARHCFDQHEALSELVRRGVAAGLDHEPPGTIDLAVRRTPDEPEPIQAALERWLAEHDEAAQLEARAAERARALAAETDEPPAPAAPSTPAPAAAPPDRRRLEPLPHERLGLLVPGLAQVLQAIARAERARPGWEQRTIPPDRLRDDRAFQRLLRERALRQVRGEGLAPEAAADDANTVGAHARYAVNHELHLRKTFWADDALAWALHETELDVPGACLRLPFPAAAFVFADARTRELADSLLELERLRRRRAVTRLTVYVIQGDRRDGEADVALAFVFDREQGDDDDDWPYLLCRELVVRDGDRLDAILDSRPSDPALTNQDPVFRAPELRKLVHLAINALLYATSATQESVQLPPARRPRRAGRGGSASGRTYTDDDVFYLPGRIDIGSVTALRSLERSETGRTALRRFMVRGHWRRPAHSWKDQRLRWIEPYWKGPELGMIIERDYRLKT